MLMLPDGSRTIRMNLGQDSWVESMYCADPCANISYRQVQDLDDVDRDLSVRRGSEVYSSQERKVENLKALPPP